MARWNNSLGNTTLRVIHPVQTGSRLVIDSVKPFQGEIKEDGKQSIGVAIKGSFQDGPSEGKFFDQIFWLHTEESERMTKMAVMAIYGYDRKQEPEFNQFAADLDQEVDPDSETLGSFWTNLVGRVVKVDIDIKPNKKTGDLQNQVKWSPV